MPRERTIDGLRDLLFAQAERLEKATPEELDAEILRAKATADVGKVVLDSARVEILLEKATGQPSGSRFLPPRDEGERKQPPRLVAKS